MKSRHQIDVRSDKKKKYDEIHKKIKEELVSTQVKPESIGDNSYLSQNQL